MGVAACDATLLTTLLQIHKKFVTCTLSKFSQVSSHKVARTSQLLNTITHDCLL